MLQVCTQSTGKNASNKENTEFWCMRICENCWILDWCFLLLMPLNCIYLHLTTASLIGGWVPETFRSFHYWQPAVDGYFSHGWQILATQPWAPTTSWRTSELSAISSEKRGSWQQMAMALRKIAQIWQHPLSDLEVRNYEYYTCYEICSATERMLSMSVSTMFFMRWSGMPHWEAVVAAKILKLWPENFSGMPAVCSVDCKNEDRWACKKGWPSVVSKNEEVCHKRQPRRRTTTVHTVHVSLIIFPRSHFPGCIFLHKQPLS